MDPRVPVRVPAGKPWLRKSHTVNAVSLMTATVAANALGLVFWAVAAHLEPPAVVGQASAAVAALTLLAMIAQLNLTNVFIRLLPPAGRHGERLVRRGYLAVVGLSLAVAAVYCVSGLGRHVLTGGWGTWVLFMLGVPVLAVFALEEIIPPVGREGRDYHRDRGKLARLCPVPAHHATPSARARRTVRRE